MRRLWLAHGGGKLGVGWPCRDDQDVRMRDKRYFYRLIVRMQTLKRKSGNRIAVAVLLGFTRLSASDLVWEDEQASAQKAKLRRERPGTAEEERVSFIPTSVWLQQMKNDG